MRTEDRIDVAKRDLQEFMTLLSLSILTFLLRSAGAYAVEESERTLYTALPDFLDAQGTSIAGLVFGVVGILICRGSAGKKRLKDYSKYMRKE